MSHAFDPAVRRVPSSTVAGRNEVLLAVHAGRVTASNPLMSLLGKHTHYLVRNADHPDGAIVEADVLLDLQAGSNEMRGPTRVQLDLDFCAAVGKEALFLQTLCLGDNPREDLRCRMGRWALDFGRAHREVLDGDPRGLLARLAEYLAERAAREVGAWVRCRLRLDESVLRPCRIETPVEARLEHFREPVRATVEAALVVSKGGEGRALRVADAPRILRDVVRDAVQAHLERAVSLHALHFQLEELVLPGIVDTIDAAVAHLGRESSFTHLRLDSPRPDVPQTLHVRTDPFTCRVDGYSREVRVEVEAVLTLANLGAALKNGPPDAVTWVRDEMQRCATSALIRARYDTLIRGLTTLKADVERAVRSRAAAIGYQIDQLVTITNLPNEELDHPFPIEVDGEFRLRATRVRAGLGLVVLLRFERFEGVERFLKIGRDVREALKEELKRRVEYELSRLTPEEAILYFDVPKDSTGTGESERTVEHMLSDRIRDIFESEFGAEVLGISFTPRETEITRRVGELKARAGRISFDVRPKRLDHLPIHYNATLLVRSVVPAQWDAFVETFPSNEDIEATARDCLTTWLSEADPKKLLDASNARLQVVANEVLERRMAEQFGLRVEVRDLSHDGTEQMRARLAALVAAAALGHDEGKETVTQVSTVQRLQRGLAVAEIEALTEEVRAIYGELARRGPETPPEERKELIERARGCQARVEELAGQANAQLPVAARSLTGPVGLASDPPFVDVLGEDGDA